MTQTEIINKMKEGSDEARSGLDRMIRMQLIMSDGNLDAKIDGRLGSMEHLLAATDTAIEIFERDYMTEGGS